MEDIIKQETPEEKITHLEAENTRLLNANRKLRRENEILKIANSDLIEQIKDLSPQAFQDRLTGMGNRRLFDLEMSEIFKAKKRLSEPGRRTEKNESLETAFIIFDLDHFKRVNDELGHGVGDQILIEVKETLESNIREYDQIYRWGGEEIVVVLNSLSREKAVKKADELRKAISNSVFVDDQKEESGRRAITVSAGLVFVSDFETKEGLFRAADEALYKSKEGGRNRVTAYSAPTANLPEEQ